MDASLIQAFERRAERRAASAEAEQNPARATWPTVGTPPAGTTSAQAPVAPLAAASGHSREEDDEAWAELPQRWLEAPEWPAGPQLSAACQIAQLPVAVELVPPSLDPRHGPPRCRCGLAAIKRYGHWWCARRSVEDEAAVEDEDGQHDRPSTASTAHSCEFMMPVPRSRPPMCSCAKPAAWARVLFVCESGACDFEWRPAADRAEPTCVPSTQSSREAAVQMAATLTAAAHGLEPPVDLDEDVASWRDGPAAAEPPRDSCIVLGCRRRLLRCHGEKVVGDAVGCAERGHVLCVDCLNRWFAAQNELRQQQNLMALTRRSCPVCQTELRSAHSTLRSDRRYVLGLLKLGWSW